MDNAKLRELMAEVEISNTALAVPWSPLGGGKASTSVLARRPSSGCWQDGT
ncbi:hypothetical protein [Actinokineospora enzanensis]|uniref:hypothetical protein n=1 Tax=Actinokineospora enzanensis TaxID=155975 RepID=UPI00036AEF6D|nr:hypothetical protein [Actinokineospora enzanensis]